MYLKDTYKQGSAQLLNFWKNRAGKNLQAGLSISHGHLSVAVVDRQNKDKPSIISLAALPCNNAKEKDASLLAACKQFQLDKIPCVFVLDTDDYSLIQTEAPNVEKDELKSALRWSIKDMLDFHIDDATLDAFELPRPTRQGISQMIYAVAARSSLVKATVDPLLDAGIKLSTMDINEMVLHNIAATQAESDEDITATCFGLEGESYIVISSRNQIYLCRHIADNLWQSSPQFTDNAEPVKNYDLLALEIQRSLDYYESHYGKGAVSRLLIFHGDGDTPEPDSFFQVPTRRIDLKQFIDGLSGYSPNEIMACLPALGGALRVSQ